MNLNGVPARIHNSLVRRVVPTANLFPGLVLPHYVLNIPFNPRIICVDLRSIPFGTLLYEVDNALFAIIPGIRRLNNCVKVFDEMEGTALNSTGSSALELQS